MKVNDFIKLLLPKKSLGGKAVGIGAASDRPQPGAESLEEIQQYMDKLGAESIEQLGKGNNGTWSFKINVQGDWMKCYQCDSVERASLVAATTSCLANQEINVPGVHAVSGRMILAEWIEGTPALDVDFRRMAAYQQKIHQAHIDSSLVQSNSKALHLEWLFRRLLEHGKAHVGSASISEVIEKVQRFFPPECEVRVVHPDFIPSNIILNGKGELVVVDNEFLGVGRGFEFDILNTARIAFNKDQHLQEEYIMCCRDSGPCGTLFSHRQFWEIVMLVKLAGKRFAFRDVKNGIEHYNELKRRLNING